MSSHPGSGGGGCGGEVDIPRRSDRSEVKCCRGWVDEHTAWWLDQVDSSPVSGGTLLQVIGIVFHSEWRTISDPEQPTVFDTSTVLELPPSSQEQGMIAHQGRKGSVFTGPDGSVGTEYPAETLDLAEADYTRFPLVPTDSTGAHFSSVKPPEVINTPDRRGARRMMRQAPLTQSAHAMESCPPSRPTSKHRIHHQPALEPTRPAREPHRLRVVHLPPPRPIRPESDLQPTGASFMQQFAPNLPKATTKSTLSPPLTNFLPC